MNRKNTILVAVLINAALLTAMLIAALSTHDELPAPHPVVADAPIPKFDDAPEFHPLAALPEPSRIVEPAPLILEPEPVVHKLPPLVLEMAPAPTALPVTAHELTVKKGDTLDKLAKAHHTSIDEIIKLNQLPSSFLKVGQVLKMPGAIEKPKAKEPAAAEYYTMKVGDNPWAIAMKHHMKLDELLRLNGLNEAKARQLKPGDRLRIR